MYSFKNFIYSDIEGEEMMKNLIKKMIDIYISNEHEALKAKHLKEWPFPGMDVTINSETEIVIAPPRRSADIDIPDEEYEADEPPIDPNANY